MQETDPRSRPKRLAAKEVEYKKIASGRSDAPEGKEEQKESKNKKRNHKKKHQSLLPNPEDRIEELRKLNNLKAKEIERLKKEIKEINQVSQEDYRNLREANKSQEDTINKLRIEITKQLEKEQDQIRKTISELEKK